MKEEYVKIKDYMEILIEENEYIESFNLSNEEKEIMCNNALLKLQQDGCLKEFYKMIKLKIVENVEKQLTTKIK